MWYFAWILGVTAAAAIAVINVMWYEFQDGRSVATAAARPALIALAIVVRERDRMIGFAVLS